MLEEPILHEIAKRQNCSAGQVCLAWVMSKNAALVTKTKSPDRMKENLEATKVHLDKEDLILIDQMTRTNQRLFLDPYKFY